MLLTLSLLFLPSSFVLADTKTTIFKPDQSEIEKLTAEIAANPDNAELYYSRGRVYLKSRGVIEFFKNNYDDLAVADFTKAIELNPNYAAAYLNRGCALISEVEYNKMEGTKEYKKSIDDFNQAIMIDPTFTLAYANRAISYIRIEKYDLSLIDADKAIELDPKFIQPYFTKAIALNKKHKTNEAIEVLRKIQTITTSTYDRYTAREVIRSFGGVP